MAKIELISHFKKVMYCRRVYSMERSAFTVVAFNLLIYWLGLQPSQHGFVLLSIAEFGP